MVTHSKDRIVSYISENCLIEHKKKMRINFDSELALETSFQIDLSPLLSDTTLFHKIIDYFAMIFESSGTNLICSTSGSEQLIAAALAYKEKVDFIVYDKQSLSEHGHRINGASKIFMLQDEAIDSGMAGQWFSKLMGHGAKLMSYAAVIDRTKEDFKTLCTLRHTKLNSFLNFGDLGIPSIEEENDLL